MKSENEQNLKHNCFISLISDCSKVSYLFHSDIIFSLDLFPTEQFCPESKKEMKSIKTI